jgi:hypothetical protein
MDGLSMPVASRSILLQDSLPNSSLPKPDLSGVVPRKAGEDIPPLKYQTLRILFSVQELVIVKTPGVSTNVKTVSVAKTGNCCGNAGVFILKK